jgi:hypothetical protein
VRGSAWDAVIKFCFEQAAQTAPDASMARGVGARAALWLGVLRAARAGCLDPGWRRDLPTFSETRSVALTAAAMDLAAESAHAWEPFTAGAGGLHAAANAWYQAVTVMLFDVIFMQADAIADGRSPDDDWHRSLLPAALQQAVRVTQIGFNTATLGPAARADFVKQLGPSPWQDDLSIFGPPPRSWNVARPQEARNSGGVRPAFFEAVRGYLTE